MHGTRVPETVAGLATLTATYDSGSAAQPAHCIVRGSAAPRTGADGKPYETRFELRLPTAWSGRFLYQGGGGNDGIVAPAVGRNTGSFPDTGLQRGFAVVTTDAGHQGPTPEFGLDPVARVDHAYAAHERTATHRVRDRRAVLRPRTRSEVLRRLLGRRTAGHDVRAAIPRVLRRHRDLRAGDERVERRDDRRGVGHTDVSVDRSGRTRKGSASSVARSATPTWRSSHAASPRRAMPPTAQRTEWSCVLRRAVSIRSAAVRWCEGCGLPDVRAGGGARADIRWSARFVGTALYVGQAWDPGIAAPGWRQWKLGSSQTGTPNAANTTLMAGALAYEFFTPPDPAFAITQFDFDRDPARMEAFSAVFDTYRDATLAAFRKRGGKLLIFHGTADPIFSALESIDYYQRLTRNNGGPEARRRWARLFLVPGMNHCAGGPATDSFDGLAAIVDWVEKGAAPSRIEASARPGTSSFAGRTRPLCAYPSSPVTTVQAVSKTARTSPAR